MNLRSFLILTLAVGTAAAQPPGRKLADGAFLGVEAVSADPALSGQLGLPPHTGLTVEELAPASPAASALKNHDVLTKVDDQILIAPYQFAVLIRSHQPGDRVTLSYVRGGKPATVGVTLVSRPLPELVNMVAPPPAHSRPDSHLAIDLPDGAHIRLEIDNGSFILTISTPDGAPLFSGPVNTRAERAALPPFAAAALEKISKLQHSTQHLAPGDSIYVPGNSPRMPVTEGSVGGS